MSIALIDADSLIYKSGFTFEDKTCWNEIEMSLGIDTTADISLSADLLLAKNAIDAIIQNIMFKTGCDDYELWVTGKGNFRYEILDTYKGNRVNVRKPIEYQNLYNYLISRYGAKKADGVEADDMVVYLKTTYPMKYTLCAIDKDVLCQTVGCHYNYGKDEFITVSEEEAIRFFWFQVLMGDGVDGYKGCKGIGKVKANKILDEAQENAKQTNVSLNDAYASAVCRTYMEANETKEYLLQTCRVANMHQIRRDKGVTYVDLFDYNFESPVEPMVSGV